MDNNETIELNAIEQAIASDPVNYLNSQPDPRKWTLSSEQIARTSSVSPYDIFSITKGQEKYNWLENELMGVLHGMNAITEPITSALIDKTAVESLTYKSPNMSKEDAMRIYEDVMRTRSFIRQRQNEETAEKIRNNFWYSMANGVGSLIAIAGVGALTGSRAAIGATAALSAGLQTKGELVDKFIQEEGTSAGLAEQRLKQNAIATGYGLFSGLTEMSIGVERLAAGAINRYAKMDALARLARTQGKYGKAAALRAGKMVGTTALEEAGEESVQSIGEDIAVQGFTEAFTDENFKKALTQAMYGGLIGGPAGAAFYYVNRKKVIDAVSNWNQENNVGMTEQQIISTADEMIDKGTHQMADEIATRAEIQNKYGPAYETIKERIRETIEATGTKPWEDENKSMEDFIEQNALAITVPLINLANVYNMPMSDFIQVADLKLAEGPTGPQPILMFAPLGTKEEIQAAIEKQKAIIKEQTAAEKLGTAKPGLKNNAQRRKAILETQLAKINQDEKIEKARTTRRKEKADYITAKDLQPEQTATIDTAVQAEEGQDFVLFAGKRIPVEYQVVELENIQPSHIDGEPNPNYTNTELQNRASRGTTQDVADLRGKALPENFTPERLTRATTSAEGAPVVNEQGEVIAGNGRAEIVRYAYENPQTAEKYKKAIKKAGFNIDGMEKPILVRRNTTMTPEEQIAAADLSNISETSAFDEASQARRDSRYLKDSATPVDFAGKLPMSERRGLMNNDGTWNARRVRQRYESALLSWLCGNDTQLFEKMILSNKLPQKVIDILVSNGSLIYELQQKYPDTSIREDLYHAIQKMQYASKDNFIEMTKQLEITPRDVMTENIMVWAWLFADSTQGKHLLQNYATKLQENHENVNAGADMFGETPRELSNKDAIMQALKTTDEERAQAAAQRGRTYEPLFSETGEVRNAELASAIVSYQNQFAPRPEMPDNIVNKIVYQSGPVYYMHPSTKFVLKGGEGQIVHGWGIYAQKDRTKNKIRYRQGRYAGKYVYVPGMPKIQQLIKGAKNQKESQIFKIVLDTIAGRTPINRGIITGFAGSSSAYMPIFYIDALYEVMGKNANQTDRDFLGKVLEKGQFADETIFKVDQKMSTWLQRAILQTLDMHKDLKNSKFYQKDLPYIFAETLTLGEVQKDFIDFVKKNFKHENLSAAANKTLAKTIVGFIQNGGRFEYEPFDNTIFQESGGQVIDLDPSYRAYDVIQALKQTIDRTTGNYIGPVELEQYIDRGILEDPKTYGGFLSLVALAKRGMDMYQSSLFAYAIASGKTTFDNIEENDDFKLLKQYSKTDYTKKLWVSLIESAQEIYKADKTKNKWNTEIKTWEALSKAFKNLTKEQTELLTKALNEVYDVPAKDVPLVLQALQNPEYIKQTRGQQLEVYVPEDDVLLNEDTFLIEQPSAPLLRKVLEDFMPGGLLYDYINRTKQNNFKSFREANGIKEESLEAFYDRLFEDIMSGLIDGKTTEEIASNKEVKLLIDYIMENLKGDDFYIATMESIQDTSIDLESGETIGEEKDYDEYLKRNVMGINVSSELAHDASLYLNDMGIKGITYKGGIDGIGYVVFSDEAIKTLQRLDDEQPIYYKKAPQPIGFYDPELQALVLGKNWDEVTLVHEFHHRYLLKLWDKYQQAKVGAGNISPAFVQDIGKLFSSLGVTEDQKELTVVQQEKFAYMVEAYLTGFGVDDPTNLAFQGFLHWIPEKCKSIFDLGYLDENGEIQNPMLDQETIDFFNRWFASPFAPSLPTAPDAQRMVNPTNEDGEPIPSEQKTMNNREKEWGQDSEKQNKADAQLWQAIGENNPSNIRAQMDGEKEIMKAEADNNPDDRILPEKPKLRDKWFHARQPDARETAAEAARAYVNNNPDHARELAFADPETMTEYDAPVDQGMLIRAVMETVQKGSDEWYILDNNLAMVKSMSGSTLSLSGDLSHQAYLDAKREVEEARELKAAANYAGTSRGAMEKWQNDINRFIAARVGAIIATTPNSTEREVAIKAFLEEAKTKFSGNTTNAILNKYDFTGYTTKDTGAFIKWAEKQIKEAAHAKIDTKEQAELMKASIAAQVALKGINSTEQKDGNFVRAVQSAKDIRHWQFVKDKMKKAYIGRWGKFGIWVDNVLGGYMPSAMLMSLNTLFFANVPSTAINTAIVQQAVKLIGENNVDEKIQKDEIKRIRQVFNGSGMNLAQMEKPTSPSLMHGEKYTNQEQAHWYNFTFDILGREDNWFRIPTFVDALARIATKNANGNKAKANQLFREYSELGNKNEDAQMARKEALAVANMAVFTQDGIMASALNHIRSQINTATRRLAGLEPGGFGLGNLLAPFLKTGANIVEMGLTSTMAPIRTIGYELKKLQGKQIPDVDKIALATDWAYFALTAVAVALMAAISGDDDDWYEKPYEPGKRYDPNKPYDSIRFGNTWVKLDIFGPWEIPLRTAAILVQDWEKKKLAAIGEGLYEALGETPLVNQFLDNQMDYMQRYPDKYWSSFAYNQANKLMPAQIKSATRGISRATGAELDVSGLGKTIERKFHRNYGLDGAQLTTNDLLNILTNRIKYVEKK